MSGAKIIKPTPITAAMLLSSTAAEPGPGETLYNPATSYALGAVVIGTDHIVYESLVAANSGNPLSNATKWLNTKKPSNRWAVYDRRIGTATTVASPFTQVLQPGAVSGVGLLELVGREVAFSMKNAPGGAVVYSKTVSLDGTIITSIYEWFFADYEQLTDLVLTDLPGHYPSCELTIALTGTSNVSCGLTQVGQIIEVGGTQRGASVGLIDYTKKIIDSWGYLDIQEGTWSKRCSLKIYTAKADFNKIYRRLAALRATPCICIGADTPGYEPFIQYGLIKDFTIVVEYELHHMCNLEFEGLSK